MRAGELWHQLSPQPRRVTVALLRALQRGPQIADGLVVGPPSQGGAPRGRHVDRRLGTQLGRVRAREVEGELVRVLEGAVRVEALHGLGDPPVEDARACCRPNSS